MNDAELEPSIEDEYAAQQSIAMEDTDNPELVSPERKAPNEQVRISLLLVDISETLKMLQEQMTNFNKAVEALPETTKELLTTTTNLRVLTDQLPRMVHEQCLNEYKKIVTNAVKNYQQFRRAADQWQKSLEEGHERKFNWIMISSIVTPILVLLNILFKH